MIAKELELEEDVVIGLSGPKKGWELVGCKKGALIRIPTCTTTLLLIRLFSRPPPLSTLHHLQDTQVPQQPRANCPVLL